MQSYLNWICHFLYKFTNYCVCFLLLNPIVIKYIGDFNCLLHKKKKKASFLLFSNQSQAYSILKHTVSWSIQYIEAYSTLKHTLSWSIPYIEAYSTLKHTVYWSIQFLEAYSTLKHTISWSIQFIEAYSILKHTIYWSIQYLEAYSTLKHTVHWSIQYIEAYSLLKHNFWTMSMFFTGLWDTTYLATLGYKCAMNLTTKLW